MKYDMCANGAPPPIQQPVITFQNKYTKRLLKKKEGAAAFLIWQDQILDTLPLQGF